MSTYVEWDALIRVVVGGVVLGAGLPALFAVGVRALAGPGARGKDGRRRPVKVTVATASFAVVVTAIITAIVLIASSAH